MAIRCSCRLSPAAFSLIHCPSMSAIADPYSAVRYRHDYSRLRRNIKGSVKR
jgi:hypothetical protein